jgi:chromosome partitioning protein
MAKTNYPAKRRKHHPHVVALVATKGGTGKSTVAACLAGELLARGYKVALLDTDPQRTLTSWHDNDGPLKAISIGTANGASVAPALQRMAAQHSVVIVDTAGFQNRDTLAVLALADFALVPFQPTPADALGTAQTVALLREVNATVERRQKPVRIALLMNSAGRGALVPHIRAEVAATGAQLLEASLHRRVAYAEAFLSGAAPCFMGSSAKAAAAELAAMADEIGF